MDERHEPTATYHCAEDDCDEIRVTQHLTELPEGWKQYNDEDGKRYFVCPLHA